VTHSAGSTGWPGQPSVGVAIPAAGTGQRMGGRRKPWIELRGEPLLLHALRPLLAHPAVVAVAVAVSAEDATDPPTWLKQLDERVRVVPGGFHRAESVRRAVQELPVDVEVIVVHDGARPFVDPEVLDRCITIAAAGQGAVAGVPATDTLKEVDEARSVVATPDRRSLWHAHTPQAFPAGILRQAYSAVSDPASFSDDASVVEAAGASVIMVDDSGWNLKVTRPSDLHLAELLLAAGSAGVGRDA
jgi:2-C-methyl-D-erythritol 4-phosphate cytidylyltransferase